MPDFKEWIPKITLGKQNANTHNTQLHDFADLTEKHKQMLYKSCTLIGEARSWILSKSALWPKYIPFQPLDVVSLSTILLDALHRYITVSEMQKKQLILLHWRANFRSFSRYKLISAAFVTFWWERECLEWFITRVRYHLTIWHQITSLRKRQGFRGKVQKQLTVNSIPNILFLYTTCVHIWGIYSLVFIYFF